MPSPRRQVAHDARPQLDRRTVLIGASAGAAALVAGRHAAAADKPSLPTADTLIAGKDRRLIVYNTKVFEIETPLELLREQNITPAQALFVRNNQQPAWALTLSPADTKDWTVEVAGLVEFPRSITLSRLAELPQVETEMVLQCSGNGRASFSRAAPAKGSPWDQGAVANVRFRGATLRSVLEALDARPNAAARFLTAEGQDRPANAADADFEHSIPLNDALDRSLLATHLNGEPLPAVHGGPLRLVTPGYYGTMHVKWLSRLRLEAQESANHHQVKRYRTPLRPIKPGAEFDYALDNSEPNWGMRIKSTIFAPLDGEQVAGGKVTVRGVAWNDGTARIVAVELSRDGGRSWQRAELTVPASPYAWYPWQAELSFAPGRHAIMCRAVDALGRTQPLDGAIDWNPAGYGWHGVHQVTFVAT